MVIGNVAGTLIEVSKRSGQKGFELILLLWVEDLEKIHDKSFRQNEQRWTEEVVYWSIGKIVNT